MHRDYSHTCIGIIGIDMEGGDEVVRVMGRYCGFGGIWVQLLVG